MLTIMKKYTIIELKLEGKTDREVNRITGISRRIVSKYWKEYQSQQEQLISSENTNEIKKLQEEITAKPKYNSCGRPRSKFTDEVKKRLYEILEEEEKKKRVLGSNKQALTMTQIHEILKNEDFDIGETTIRSEINKYRKKYSECFIRQQYEYGERLEYDFGEFKAIIDGVLKKYYLAVMVSPASNHRWAYIYKNANKEVFMDSQVKFFHQFGGIWKEMVYDNMKNVVTKFIGPNDKELNEDLIKLSLYYGFKINVTNCYAGNEKGSVEGGVKFIRNKCFAKVYEFASEEVMQEYLESELIKLNENSMIEKEIQSLLPLKPRYELAEIRESKVNNYSLIKVDNNFYSVPEYLVGKEVTTKIYLNDLYIYVNNEYVCNHKKIDGYNQIVMDIKHYLNTFLTKPGALKNSHVLKSNPELKSIYDNYYSKDSQETQRFIKIIKENLDKSIDEIIEIFKEYINNSATISREVMAKKELEIKTNKSVSLYNKLILGSR